MRKVIEFQTNHHTPTYDAQQSKCLRGPCACRELPEIRHRFEAGKTKIRLLPSMAVDSNWLLEIPTLQDRNGRHTHPRALKIAARSAQSVYDPAYAYMKNKYPARLFGRSNKAGIRLFPLADFDLLGELCRIPTESNFACSQQFLRWQPVAKLVPRLAKLYDQALRDSQDGRRPGHPLNH